MYINYNVQDLSQIIQIPFKMPFTSQLRIISRPFIKPSPIFKQTSIRMSSTNQYGQGASHATGQSAVPNKVQEAAPKGLEESLPESVSVPFL